MTASRRVPRTDLALALSCSGGPCTAALRRADGEVLVAEPTPGPVAAAAALCHAAGVARDALAELRVDIGPGSYTGLRAAVTFARVLHEFAGATLSVATSLELLALDAWRRGTAAADATVRVVLDARRQRYHHAALRLAEHVELVGAPAAVPLDELAAAITRDEVVLADPALHARLAAAVTARHASLAALAWPAEGLATRLFDAQIAPRPVAAEALEPLYLMGSYAE